MLSVKIFERPMIWRWRSFWNQSSAGKPWWFRSKVYLFINSFTNVCIVVCVLCVVFNGFLSVSNFLSGDLRNHVLMMWTEELSGISRTWSNVISRCCFLRMSWIVNCSQTEIVTICKFFNKMKFKASHIVQCFKTDYFLWLLIWVKIGHIFIFFLVVIFVSVFLPDVVASWVVASYVHHCFRIVVFFQELIQGTVPVCTVPVRLQLSVFWPVSNYVRSLFAHQS